MESENKVPMLLSDMPEDMLRFIFAKVASSSPIDFVSARLSSKSLTFDATDPAIAKVLSLSPFVKNPKKAKNYISLLNSCMKAGNLDAHYVFGVLQFFEWDNKYLGLHHLQLSCEGGNPNGSYLFGVLMMFFGRIEKGKKLINNLTDTVGITVVEDCWGTIQMALSKFILSVEDVYVDSYVLMKPELHCHPGENNTVCSECYHFFLMTEFFDMLLGLNTIGPY